MIMIFSLSHNLSLPTKANERDDTKAAIQGEIEKYKKKGEFFGESKCEKHFFPVR